MDTTKIAEGLKLIPEKKENLRKAFEALESYSSSLSTFALQWKDLDDHISSIESSIHERFDALQQQQQQQQEAAINSNIPISIPTTTTTTTTENNDNNTTNTNAQPRPELKSLCANMDAKGLRSFISANQNDLLAIMDELAMALRSAPDPALLVLDAMDGFHPPNPLPPKTKRRGRDSTDGELQFARRICINLLENLCLISPEIKIKDFVKERALKLAVEWKGKIPESGDNALQAMGFLQLIASYGLVSEFELDDVMELFVCVSRRKQAVDLIKSLGFAEKAHDLIQKLSSKGRQLDAVKIAYGLNIVDKFPPVPLLKAYIYESKKRANELRRNGNNSVQAKNDATAKEMGALKSVLKAIEQHKLEGEYPRENLVKRIAQLEDQKKSDKKRAAVSVAAPNSKILQNQQSKKRTAAAAASNSKTQLKQQSNKRPRPSPSTSASATTTLVTASRSYTPLLQPLSQLGLAERAPYMGVAGPYGLAASCSVYSHDAPSLSSGLAATGSVYNHCATSLSGGVAATGSSTVMGHGGPSLSGTAMGHGGPGLSGTAMGQGQSRSPPRANYSSESNAGTSSLYDRPVAYHGYPLVGVPSPYGSSLYP